MKKKGNSESWEGFNLGFAQPEGDSRWDFSLSMMENCGDIPTWSQTSKNPTSSGEDWVRKTSYLGKEIKSLLCLSPSIRWGKRNWKFITSVQHSHRILAEILLFLSFRTPQMD